MSSAGSPSRSSGTSSSSTKKCQRRRATCAYKLRPRRTSFSPSNTRSTAGSDNEMGRFPDWQTDILAHIFNSEIWNPGDKTVMLLEWQFKGRRTKKQISDWFSHRRRCKRKSGVQGPRNRDKAIALDGLIQLRYNGKLLGRAASQG